MSKDHEQIDRDLDKKLVVEQQRIADAEQTLHRLGYRQQAADRRQRTRRLIQIGAIVEHWIGRSADPEVLSATMHYIIYEDSDQTLGELIQELYLHESKQDN